MEEVKRKVSAFEALDPFGDSSDHAPFTCSDASARVLLLFEAGYGYVPDVDTLIGERVQNIDEPLTLGRIVCRDDDHGLGLGELGTLGVSLEAIQKQRNVAGLGVGIEDFPVENNMPGAVDLDRHLIDLDLRGRSTRLRRRHRHREIGLDRLEGGSDEEINEQQEAQINHRGHVKNRIRIGLYSFACHGGIREKRLLFDGVAAEDDFDNSRFGGGLYNSFDDTGIHGSVGT